MKNDIVKKEFDSKNFFKMMRRLSHCGYPIVIMNNRMFMNCYNIDEDETNGMHFIMFIDDDSELYDELCVIDYARISNLGKLADSNVSAYRKENKLKPKDVETLSYYYSLENVVELHIERYDKPNQVLIDDTMIILERATLPKYRNLAENIETSYFTMISRLDDNYDTEFVNGISEQIYERAVTSVRPLYYEVTLNDGTRVYIPFIKSFFRDIRKFNRFDIAIRRTTINNVYLIAFVFESNSIVESYIMYIENLI